MQPSSPSAGIALVASAEMQAMSPVVSSQAVVHFPRPVRAAASATVGRRRGAKASAFCNRWVRGVRAASPVRPSSPNPTFEPTAASGVGSIPR